MATIDTLCMKYYGSKAVGGKFNEITVGDGKQLKGRYMLVECGAVTPSHDALHGFRKSPGFPTDKRGQTVNDRDYERDTFAQDYTHNIARNYDNRALQSPVVVSLDGVVLSGNGRTMAGELAARDNTDSAYIDYLKNYCSQYGFTPDQVSKFKHPRIVFQLIVELPYSAKTFAMFNREDKKTMTPTEKAISLGKQIDDHTFNRTIKQLNLFDTLCDFYADTNACKDVINDLYNNGIIGSEEINSMFDGDLLSAHGREFLELVLIGKAFDEKGDTVRMITAHRSTRKNIITALAEICNCMALGDYALTKELHDAIALVFDARNAGYLFGDVVSGYARQQTMFSDSSTVADYQDKVVMLLADMINGKQVTRLKKVFAIYNAQANDAANGQTDTFSANGIKSKQEILNDVYNQVSNWTKKEERETLNNATKQRIEAAREAQQERERKAQQSEEKPQETATETKKVEVVIINQDTTNDEEETAEVIPDKSSFNLSSIMSVCVEILIVTLFCFAFFNCLGRGSMMGAFAYVCVLSIATLFGLCPHVADMKDA